MLKEFGLQLRLPENPVHEELLGKLRNPDYLPTLADINQLIGINPLAKRIENTLATIRLTDARNDYEFWTTEYIEELGKYLERQIHDIQAEKEEAVTILEVGAGSGRLSNFLRTRSLSKTSDALRIIATDNGILNIQPEFSVEKLDYQTALRKYNPDIVLCSFMPRGEDWTPAFRQQSGVREYIVIGDTDCCGTNDTYGFGEDGKANFKDGAFETINALGYIPPHERDGFVMNNLYFGKLSHCRYDNVFIPDRSRTLSFTRKK